MSNRKRWGLLGMKWNRELSVEAKQRRIDKAGSYGAALSQYVRENWNTV